MSNDEEVMDFQCTPPDIQEAASFATMSLLPEKSRKRYNITYDKFMTWCKKKNVSVSTENVILAYLAELSTTYASSTMWSEYSLLKATLIAKNNIDNSKMPKLVPFLKRKSEGFKPKKAKIFSREEINKFLNDAPDEVYLMMKVSVFLSNDFKTIFK